MITAIFEDEIIEEALRTVAWYDDHPASVLTPPPFSANHQHRAAAAALLTRQSNQHHFNQDRAVLVKPYVTKQTSNQKRSFLAGVFDGHGHDGHAVAQAAADALPAVLAEKLNAADCCQTDEWIAQQLKETFLAVNLELPPFAALRGGCTASVTLRIGTKLFIANAGDSRTIVVANENATTTADAEIIYETRLDKAHLPEEKARIEGMGGKIHIPPKHLAGSRVVVYSSAAKPPEPIGLAISRSLGDWEWKEVGVVAEPIVDVLDKSSYGKSFILAATDGVWDTRKSEFFAQYFWKHVFEEGQAPIVAVHDVIQKVSPIKKEWYRDDMTLLYVDAS
jgi:serine/threonine protein phosphatase PrpC